MRFLFLIMFCVGCGGEVISRQEVYLPVYETRYEITGDSKKYCEERARQICENDYVLLSYGKDIQNKTFNMHIKCK